LPKIFWGKKEKPPWGFFFWGFLQFYFSILSEFMKILNKNKNWFPKNKVFWFFGELGAGVEKPPKKGF